MKIRRKQGEAFSLVELAVGSGLLVVIGGITWALFRLGLTLHSQSLAIGLTHSAGLGATSKMLMRVAAASETPVLTDDTGAIQPGDGPAAGLRFFSPASIQPYVIDHDVKATDLSMKFDKSASLPPPQIGDKIAMNDVGFQGVITAVSTSGGKHEIWFASTIGSGFKPAKSTGTVIPEDWKCFLYQPSAFISVNGTLRFYPRGLSVAGEGVAAFNNQKNFKPIAVLIPAGGQTNAFPFRYLDPTRRTIDVHLPLGAPAFANRVTSFYTYQNMKTTLAFRSAVTQ